MVNSTLEVEALQVIELVIQRAVSISTVYDVDSSNEPDDAVTVMVYT